MTDQQVRRATGHAPRRHADPLRPYLARVTLDWLGEEPDARHRTLNGTLLFADISGFTPLTERLARQGKVGAEALTDVLNDVFGRLLRVGQVAGGDLLKFGGDALLLLFTGDDHVARAAGGAIGLLEALRPFRRFQTVAGRVGLTMSMGLESGPVQLLLVGDSHRELFAVGPVVSAAVSLENRASGGEILVGPVAARALGPALLTERDGDRRLLAAPAVAAVSPPGAKPADASPGVPVMLREHLRHGREDGEHRVASLAFLQARGTDVLLAERGLAAVAAEVERLVVRTQQACVENGVTFLATDVDVDGVKVLLVAGAPRVGEADEARMLLSLRAAVGGDSELSVRAGASRGRAFAVDVGTDDRRTYAVMGDATNLAARVMGKAAPGEVLATRALLDHTDDAFEIQPRPPLQVKGKSQPVLAAVVGAPTRGASTDPRALPFVGRETETLVLRRTLSHARAGRGGLVELVGEPGLGKSRLVAELVADAGDSAVFTIEGGRYAAATPYLAVRWPLRALIGATLRDDDAVVASRLHDTVAARAPDALPWLPLLADLVGVELPDTPEVAALAPEFRSTVRHVQATQLLATLLPERAVLVVEDAHRLDEATGHLLDLVAGLVTERSWLMCVTRRPGDRGWTPKPELRVASLALEPLSEAESTELLRRVAAQRPLLPSARRVLAARAAGNPLFLRELLGAVAEGDDGTDLAVLPDTLEGVIGAEVDRLAREDRDLLRVAAVLGARFDVDTLTSMLGQRPSEVARRLQQLDGFLAPDGDEGMRFRHGLVRDVAYEGLPFRRRRVLHGRAGDVLLPRLADQESLVDLLALHYRAADRHNEAWRHGRAAGERAQRSSAPVEAARFFRWALQAAAHLPEVAPVERAEVGERLGDMLELDGRYDDAAGAFAAARRMAAADQLRLVGLLKKEGWVRERSGRYSSALSWYTRALRHLEGRDDDEAARMRAQLTMSYGAARARQGRYADSLSHLHRAAAEAERLDDQPTLAHAYYLLDWALTDLGRPEAASYREKSLPIYERLGDLVGQASVLNNLGIDAYYEGRWDEARDLYERSRVVCHRSGNVTLDGTALNNIGEILSDQGRLAEAEDVFLEALALWRSIRFPVGLGLCLSNLGRAASRGGRQDEAMARFQDARGHFTSIGADAFLVELDSREAERLVLAGQPAPALVVADAATARAETLGGMPVVLAMLDRLAGVAHAQLGDMDAANRRLAASRARATAANADYELALTLHEWSRVEARSDDPEAQGLEVAARAILDRLGVGPVPEAPLPGPTITLAGPRHELVEPVT